jgi:hypothetical protein
MRAVWRGGQAPVASLCCARQMSAAPATTSFRGDADWRSASSIRLISVLRFRAAVSCWFRTGDQYPCNTVRLFPSRGILVAGCAVGLSYLVEGALEARAALRADDIERHWPGERASRGSRTPAGQVSQAARCGLAST